MSNKALAALRLLIFACLCQSEDLAPSPLLIQVCTEWKGNSTACETHFYSIVCAIPDTSGALNQFNYSHFHSTIALTIVNELGLNSLELGPHILAKVPSLKVIRLWGVSVLSKTFHSSSALLNILIHQSLIHNIEDNFLVPGNALEYLSIRDTYVPLLSRAFLAHLVHVTTLLLHRTRLEVIEIGAFGNLTSLQKLSLSGNNLARFDSVFMGLPQLHYLDLSHNNILVLDTVFENLTALRILQLSANNIQLIRAGAFKNLRSLTTLDLSSNKIPRLGGWLTHLPQLTTLRVYNNQIKNIEGGAIFNSYPALKKLSLWNNQIPKAVLKLFAEHLQKRYANGLEVDYSEHGD